MNAGRNLSGTHLDDGLIANLEVSDQIGAIKPDIRRRRKPGRLDALMSLDSLHVSRISRYMATSRPGLGLGPGLAKVRASARAIAGVGRFDRPRFDARRCGRRGRGQFDARVRWR